jgi:hypothetical protein
MSTYLGILDRRDPLHEVLVACTAPERKVPIFHVERLSPRHLVYLYREAGTGSTVVGKFFDLNEHDEAKRARIRGEYANLMQIRSLGLTTHPWRIVRPLGREARIGLAVAEEFVRGKDLDYFVRRACRGGDTNMLMHILKRLATFLFRLHALTQRKRPARLDQTVAYFGRIVDKLVRQTVLDTETARTSLRLRDRWMTRSCMAADAVIVHGDATPTNFIFPDDGGVVAIDLERTKQTDRTYDLGMVCGELKHAFLWRTGNKYAAERFIRGFLTRYSNHFSNQGRGFTEITRRLPFYMALTELRIARNEWLDWGYRQRLAHEALTCLRCGLML